MLRKLPGTACGAPYWPNMRPGDDEQSIPRYLLANGVIGFAAGLLWGGMMLLTNTAGLATLVSASPDPIIAVALVLGGSAGVITPVALAAAVFSLAE
jgi:hypothetical protein